MSQKQRKLYAGARLRNLRDQEKLTQKDLAARLGVSTSYLNQIENNQRPLSAGVLLALVDSFDVDLARFATDESDRLVTDLREALLDPVFGDRRVSLQELKMATSNTPEFAHALLSLHRAFQASREKLASLDAELQRHDGASLPQPYDEVRDFFHYKDNYIDWLDRGAEGFALESGLSGENGVGVCIERLRRLHDVEVRFESADMAATTFRRFDPDTRLLRLNSDLRQDSQYFQLLQQLAMMEEDAAMEQILDDGSFRTDEARAIAKLGLANYFAGAAMMPYGAFHAAAREMRHDLELLARRFGASLEQVSHRLSTLQRPGMKGVPFFFLRVDRAGTITKRHSATRLQFARFGGACPLWSVHRAFERPGEFIRQLATTPDGERYFCIARTITKRGRGFNAPIRRYSIGLGCQIAHAGDILYADDFDVEREENFEKIGISCRICERVDCAHRAVPPIGRRIRVDPSHRSVVPFSIEPEG